MVRMAWLVVCVLVAGGCAEDPETTSFPPPAELPEQSEPPALLSSEEGQPVSAEEWPARRETLLGLFSHYIYGFSPPAEAVSSIMESEAVDVDGAIYEEFEIRSGPAALHLALFRPPGGAPTPVLLALNKCGNQSLTSDTRVRLSTSSLLAECNGSAEETRDERGASWPIREIVERGYTLATFHESDIRLDSRDAEGIGALIEVDAPEEARWGAVAQWAWGLQRAVDFLVTDAGVNAEQIVVTGHSRRGKAALWAAAQDPRIAVVAPHQSGTAGASMARGGTGEPLAAITLFFPFWFAPNYTEFAEALTRLPVDQHMLLALVAPRGLVSTNGAGDFWADPEGALRTARLAAPAWELLGARGLVEVDGSPTFEGELSWHTREGGHSLDAADWQTFMDFADVRFGR